MPPAGDDSVNTMPDASFNNYDFDTGIENSATPYTRLATMVDIVGEVTKPLLPDGAGVVVRLHQPAPVSRPSRMSPNNSPKNATTAN